MLQQTVAIGKRCNRSCRPTVKHGGGRRADADEADVAGRELEPPAGAVAARRPQGGARLLRPGVVVVGPVRAGPVQAAIGRHPDRKGAGVVVAHHHPPPGQKDDASELDHVGPGTPDVVAVYVFEGGCGGPGAARVGAARLVVRPVPPGGVARRRAEDANDDPGRQQRDGVLVRALSGVRKARGVRLPRDVRLKGEIVPISLRRGKEVDATVSRLASRWRKNATTTARRRQE